MQILNPIDNIIIDGKAFEGYAIPTTNSSLLLIRGKGGMLGCGYLSVETADRIGDVLAVVRGVNNYEDMQARHVVEVSKAAAKLGIEVGMSGKDALLKML